MHLHHHSHPPRSTFIVGHSVEGRREGTPGIDKDLWNVALIQSSPKNALLGCMFFPLNQRKPGHRVKQPWTNQVYCQWHRIFIINFLWRQRRNARFSGKNQLIVLLLSIVILLFSVNLATTIWNSPYRDPAYESGLSRVAGLEWVVKKDGGGKP